VCFPVLLSCCGVGAALTAVALPSQRKAQYKSAIWYHSPEQELIAREAIASLESRFGKVFTDVEPAAPWTDAEEYHQMFYLKQKAKRG
jgi:peptide methionine sulfoxide reductase MsrA